MPQMGQIRFITDQKKNHFNFNRVFLQEKQSFNADVTSHIFVQFEQPMQEQ